TLVTKPTHIIPFFTKQVAETGNIKTCRAPAEIIFVLIAVHGTRSAYPEMMVHQVMAQFAAAAAQSARPYIRGRIEQYPGAVHGRSAQEDHLGSIFNGFISLCIYDLYPLRFFGILIV